MWFIVPTNMGLRLKIMREERVGASMRMVKIISSRAIPMTVA